MLAPAIVSDCTSTVTVSPFVTARENVEADAVSVSTQVFVNCLIVITYPVSSAPPVIAGGSHSTVTNRSEAVAVNTGASGRASGVAEPITPLPVVPDALRAEIRRKVCCPFVRPFTVKAVAVSNARLMMSPIGTTVHEFASVDFSTR